MAQDPGSDLLGAGVGLESVTQGMSASSVAQGFHPTVAFTHNHDSVSPGGLVRDYKKQSLLIRAIGGLGVSREV